MSTCGVKRLVSVILPVYNHANFLAEAIKGVLDQTYGDLELIVVDDGSTDNFAEAISPFLQDRRLRVVRQPNQGLPSALNNGFAFARGQYLTWTSADNIMLPEQLGVLVAALEARPDVGLVYSDYEAIDDRGQPIADAAWRSHNRPDGSSVVRLPDTVTVQNFHDSGDNFLGASFLWRAEVHTIVGSHDEHSFGGEDYDFWLRMHLVTPFAHVPRVLYKYRVHDNTLNARAKEMNLLGNIRRLLDADRERREVLLANGALSEETVDGCWRVPSQYGDRPRHGFEILKYSEFAATRILSSNPERVTVVVVDVDLRLISPDALRAADIVVAPSDLTYRWIRSLQLPRHIRILFGEPSSLMPAIQHAAAMRWFERILEDRGHVLSVKPPATGLPQQNPQHILMMIGRWRIGGIEQVMIELALGLLARGLRVTLASADEGPSPELRAVASRLGLAVAAFEGGLPQLIEYVRTNGVDLVNYHHCSLGAAQLRRLGLATAYTAHNSYVWFDESQRAAFRDALQHMKAVICVSRQVASYLQTCFGAASARITVIPNGTDIEGPAARMSELGSDRVPSPPTDAFSFINIATFNRVKAQDRLLRAFARVAETAPSVHLTLCGHPADARFYDEVLELRSRLALTAKVDIVAGANRTDVMKLLREHNCFVLPSIVEGWSISLLEAAMCGVPAIVTDVGSARDIAALSHAVKLIPSLGQPLETMDHLRLWSVLQAPSHAFEKALATAMREVLSAYDNVSKEARQASQRIRDTYSTDRMVENYLACFREARAFDPTFLE
jgi:glycosyltransferase involved in cell wall biosynthesis